MSFGVPVAEVVEVEDTPQGIRLTGAWIVADVGIALDPGIIEAQLTGAMIYGLSAAMTGEVTFADGVPRQATFWDFDALRMRQCPPIFVKVLESGDPIRGVGEPGTPPAAPALANAIFALTGMRHRSLPLNRLVTFVEDAPSGCSGSCLTEGNGRFPFASRPTQPRRSLWYSPSPAGFHLELRGCLEPSPNLCSRRKLVVLPGQTVLDDPSSRLRYDHFRSFRTAMNPGCFRISRCLPAVGCATASALAITDCQCASAAWPEVA